MGIYLVVSTDSVLEDDTYDLFNKIMYQRLVFILLQEENIICF